MSISGCDAWKRFFKVIDVWEFGWDEKLGTVPPHQLCKEVLRRGLDKKNIIWFMQPHFPYMASETIIRALKEAYRKCPELLGSWLPIIAMFSLPQARKSLSTLTKLRKETLHRHIKVRATLRSRTHDRAKREEYPHNSGPWRAIRRMWVVPSP